MNKDNVKNFMKFAAENRKELGDTFKSDSILFVLSVKEALTSSDKVTY